MRTGSLVRLLLTFALSALYDSARGQGSKPPSPNGGATPGIGPMANLNDACEFKTINYITHSLPQQCHKSAWSPTTPTAAASTSSMETAPTKTTTAATIATTSTKQPEPAKVAPKEGDAVEDDSHDMTTSTFMSFEEWKEMMLKKQGQDPASIQSRKHHENRGDNYGSHSEMDTLGDDSEIDLNFDVLTDKITEYTGHGANQHKARDEQQESTAREDPNTAPIVRSKDAGKTCKERFSYSSFDAGATVLKTSPGAKNAKAILVETKDTYMLLECAKPHKFIVVELSDDILVDTIVLANYEFFSSMIRHFRVGVSDRYPVKADKWTILGTFEARNSRDIQAFLVENPAIWAKYLRIEFLSHYGNEYYCPISLLRVHGTRMLETWNQAEAEGVDDEEGPEEVEPPPRETTLEPVAVAEPVVSDVCSPFEDGSSPTTLFLRAECRYMCPVASPTIHDGQGPSAVAHEGAPNVAISQNVVPEAKAGARKGERHMARPSQPSTATPSSTNTRPSSTPEVPPAKASDTGKPQPALSSSSSASSAAAHESSTAPAKPRASATNGKPHQQGSSNEGGTPTATKNKTTTSAGAASPTVQESFFKTVSKRLAQLESNTNMSMQYIESQSRFLQQTLQGLERKQLGKVDSFLDALNTTVLSELHVLKQQYDQVWQSTVIALESQKEQSARESVALSHRIQLLADEVVFQKRMAIAQAVLSVVALGLVVFQTRAVSGAAALVAAGGAGGTGGGGHPVPTFWENQRAAWMMGMGSPQQPGTPRSPAGRATGTRLEEDYVGGSGTPTPVKRPSYFKSYKSDSSGIIQLGAGDQSSLLPMTPTLGSDQDEDGGEESPATPPLIKTRVVRERSSLSSVRTSGTSSSDEDDGRNQMMESGGGGRLFSLTIEDEEEQEEFETNDSSGRSIRETSTASTDGGSSLAPSVFERAGTVETLLDSELGDLEAATTTITTTSPGLLQVHHRIVSTTAGVKRMPSLPEDSGSGSGSSSDTEGPDDGDRP